MLLLTLFNMSYVYEMQTPVDLYKLINITKYNK